MSNEIKEILDKLNEDKDYDDYVDYKGSYFKPLLDYITNLQTIEQQYSAILSENAELQNRITNLQEKNDILKRDIEAMKHNYNLLVRCIENGESMTQKFENGLTYQDYKSRNEKARKMIQFIAYNSERPLTITELNKVYNILGGDDNE